MKFHYIHGYFTAGLDHDSMARGLLKVTRSLERESPLETIAYSVGWFLGLPSYVFGIHIILMTKINLEAA